MFFGVGVLLRGVVVNDRIWSLGCRIAHHVGAAGDVIARDDDLDVGDSQG